MSALLKQEKRQSQTVKDDFRSPRRKPDAQVVKKKVWTDMKTDFNKKKKKGGGQGACDLSALDEKLIAIKKQKQKPT